MAVFDKLMSSDSVPFSEVSINNQKKGSKSHFVTTTLNRHLCIAEPARQAEKKFEPEEEKQTAEEVFHDTDDSIEGEEQVKEIYLH